MAFFVISIFVDNSFIQCITKEIVTSKSFTTLAIETSCDDTSIALVSYRAWVFSVDMLLSYTQLAHQKRWWVVPELAARSHTIKLPELIDAVEVDRATIDAISVTSHPWLPSALTVWVTVAHTLWTIHQKPVIHVNHIMGHVFSILAWRSLESITLPYCCLTVSGGHNDIYLVEDIKTVQFPQYIQAHTVAKRNHLALWEHIDVGPYRVTKFAQTADDAAWEVFDKVARMLWWPYPWWKWIQDTASDHGLALLRSFSIPSWKEWVRSFSGLKSQVEQMIQSYKTQYQIESSDLLPSEIKEQIAYNFQQAVAQWLSQWLEHVYDQYQRTTHHRIATIWVVWWVSANVSLRAHLERSGYSVLFPKEFVYCTDNAAMIWVVWCLQSGLLSL